MLNFIRFAQAHKLPYLDSGHHHCHQGWIQTHCPNCTNGTHGFHLGFSLTKGNFNCWRCGSVKRVDMVRGLLHVTLDKAYQILRKFDDARPDGRKTPKARRRKLTPPTGLEPLRASHRRYLTGRGFDAEHLEDLWELKATRHLSGKWNWRIVFPIYNRVAEVVAYQGRTIHDHVRPKYRMTEDAKCLEDPAGLIYGIHKVPGDSILVVEGATDVWNMGPGTVGTLGIDWKLPKANKLRRFKNRFIIFDPEKKAQERAKQLADWLSYYPGHTEIITELSNDPGSLPHKEVKAIRLELLGEDA